MSEYAPFVFRTGEFGPAAVIELNKPQQRAIEIQEYEPLTLDPYLSISFARFKTPLSCPPPLPERVVYHALSCPLDVTHYRVTSLLVQGSNFRPIGPLRMNDDIQWTKTPVSLNISVNREKAILEYRDTSTVYLKVDADHCALSKDFFSYVVSDTTGAFQIPTRTIIDEKLCAAKKQAAQFHDYDFHFYRDLGTAPTFESGDLVAAQRFARRLHIDITPEVSEVSDYRNRTWRESWIQNAPKIISELKRELSDYLRNCDCDNQKSYDFEKMSGRLMNVYVLVRTGELVLDQTLRKEIAEVSVLRTLAVKNQLRENLDSARSKVSHLEKELAWARKVREESTLACRTDIPHNYRELDGLLSCLGYSAKEMRVLKTEIQVPVREDTEDDVPF